MLRFVLISIALVSPALADTVEEYACVGGSNTLPPVELLIDGGSGELFELEASGLSLAHIVGWSDDFISYVIPVRDPDRPVLVSSIFNRADARLVVTTLRAEDTTTLGELTIVLEAFQCELK